jgi:hypothetical protein
MVAGILRPVANRFWKLKRLARAALAYKQGNGYPTLLHQADGFCAHRIVVA